jgi:hypothetical protein
MEYTILFLFTLLILKHFLADFVFQTNTMVMEKGTYGARGGIQHSAIHAVLTGLVFYAVFIDFFSIVLIAFIDGVVHYHIDWAKMNINKNKNLTPADEAFWFWLGLDQLMHYLTYIGLIALVI